MQAMVEVTIAAEGSDGGCVRSPTICDHSHTLHAAQCKPRTQSHASAWLKGRQEGVCPWRARPPPGSDNGHYVAHGLALRNEIRTWCGVEKSAVAKNGHVSACPAFE